MYGRAILSLASWKTRSYLHIEDPALLLPVSGQKLFNTFFSVAYTKYCSFEQQAQTPLVTLNRVICGFVRWGSLLYDILFCRRWHHLKGISEVINVNIPVTLGQQN